MSASTREPQTTVHFIGGSRGANCLILLVARLTICWKSAFGSRGYLGFANLSSKAPSVTTSYNHTVAPRVGAWIETRSVPLRAGLTLRRALVSAWIETSAGPQTPASWWVASRADAWIETDAISAARARLGSRVPRGRVVLNCSVLSLQQGGRARANSHGVPHLSV